MNQQLKYNSLNDRVKQIAHKAVEDSVKLYVERIVKDPELHRIVFLNVHNAICTQLQFKESTIHRNPLNLNFEMNTTIILDGGE